MKKILLLLAFLGTVSYACSDDDDNQTPCTNVYTVGIVVSVSDVATAEVLSDGITVTATDGDYAEELELLQQTNKFYGAYERAGTYTITVSGAGYQPQTETVTVTADECHVITQNVDIALQPVG